MDQEAIVARVDGDHAYVEVGGVGAGCGRCHEAGGCQSGILGQLFRSRPRQYRLANLIDAVPGERVIVRVADGTTLRAVLLTYALPVLFLLFGAAAGRALGDENGNNDFMTALGALLGLAVGSLSGLCLRRVSVGMVEVPILVRRNSSHSLLKEACQ